MIPCLTLIRPMAAAIVHGTKRIENRPKDLPKKMRGVRTIVGVHAGKKWDEDYLRTVCEIDGGRTRGDSGDLTCPAYWERLKDEGIVGLMLLTGRVYSGSMPGKVCDGVDWYNTPPWYSGPFGYEIAEAIAFEKPIPCRGMLGFWTPVFDRTPSEIVSAYEVLQRMDSKGWFS
jgi:hypothetical protein